MGKIKLITFDMAGTTVHDEGYVHKAFMDAFESEKLPISFDAANLVMGYKKPIAIEMMLKSEHKIENPSSELIHKIHEQFVSNMINFYKHDESVREINGVTDLFHKLKEKGIFIGLETGFSRDITDVIIKRLSWESLVDVSTTSDEVENGRPYPEMILSNMEKLGISDSSEVCKVGDTTVDLKSGNNANCAWNIGVCSGAYTKEQLATEKHTHILNSVVDILELV